MHKWSRWIGRVCLILLPAMAALSVWSDQILLWIAPKTVLANAVSDARIELQDQLQYSILGLAGNYVDPEGNYSVSADFQIPNKLLDAVHCNLNMQINSKNHQIAAKGAFFTDKTTLDITAYADNTFLAGNIGDITQGKFYGITYQSFLQDIQKIPLLPFFFSDETLNAWDQSVQNLQSGMNWGIPSFTIMDFSQIDLEQLDIALIALPCSTEQRMVVIEGNPEKCKALTYTISADTLKKYYPDTGFHPDGNTEVTCYLLKNKLVKVKLHTNSSQAVYSLDADLRPQTGHSKGKLSCTNNKEPADSWALTFETNQAANGFSEKWKLLCKEDTLELFSQYHPSAETWQVSALNAAGKLDMILKETEEGLQLRTDQFCELIRAIWRKDVFEIAEGKFCITIKPGSDIAVPQYINIDQWTMEDLWNLLSQFGALLGLSFLP